MPGLLRRSDVLPFALGFLLAYGVVAYVALVLGTIGIGCIAVAGNYCNWFYPELFFLNAFLGVPNGTPLAEALAFSSWGLLALVGGFAGTALGRVLRRPGWSTTP